MSGNIGSTDQFLNYNGPEPRTIGYGPGSETLSHGRGIATNSSGEPVNHGPHIVWMSTEGGLGTTVVGSTLASSFSGATLIVNGNSSGQVYGIPAPIKGMYFRILHIAAPSSNASGWQLPSTAYDFIVPAGASLSTGDLIQSTAANAEGGLSFELIGISTQAYMVIPGDQPGTTLVAAQSS